ncbi:MAG TPA: hypothetical protein VN030_15390 [Cellvibrio sp.]|nr:hypothetical protein [Cellvibrio sp.]
MEELLARAESEEDTEEELGKTGTSEDIDEAGNSDELPNEEAGKDEATEALLATALLARAELEGLASLAVTALTLDTWATLDKPCDRSEDATESDREEAFCWLPAFLLPLPPPPQAVKVATSIKENNRRMRE